METKKFGDKIFFFTIALISIGLGIVVMIFFPRENWSPFIVVGALVGGVTLLAWTFFPKKTERFWEKLTNLK